MSFWYHEHKRQLKELNYLWKAQKYAYREEKRKQRELWRINKRKNRRCTCLKCKGKRMLLGLIIGVLLILLGISQIAETLFNLHIPVFGIIFGLFLLYLGVQFITGFSFWPKSAYTENIDSQNCHGTCTGSSQFSIDEATLNAQKSPLDYKTVMGKSLVDLTHLSAESIRATGTQLIVNVDTVFGQTVVKLNKDIPVRIIAKGGFAKVTTPDNSSMVFGTHTYNSHINEQPLMVIYTSTIFGKTKITVE